MRLRLFIIIFSVLCVTAVSISSIHYHFFRTERLRLIELNLEQNAAILSSADLALTKKEFSDLGQEFTDDLIGDDKVNMIVAIYNLEGKILYKNDNAYIFNLPDHISPDLNEWEDVEEKDYFIKYLTTLHEGQQRIIKVGMILNQSLLRWKDLNQRISLYVGIVLALILIVSFFLTYILFRPFNSLAHQINEMAEKVEHGEYVDLQYWLKLLSVHGKRHDEFQGLISSLHKLANKISDNQRMTQKWSALMAHELKTPMTILRMSIDRLTSHTGVPLPDVEAVEFELKKLEQIVMDFLEWASVENDTAKPQLHVINVAKRTNELVGVIQAAYPQTTFEFKAEVSEMKIFSNPLHFDQLLNNLLVNAAKYASSRAVVTLNDESLSIQDDGPGIPDSVLENFGRPFNKFTQKDKAGHGLGLAWVNTIARKYEWKISLSNEYGSKIIITFPQFN